MYHILFIHLSVGGHLGCFHLLAIRNDAANEHSCTSFCVNTCFLLSWIYT